MEASLSVDVLVVGAGPAGLAAALRLGMLLRRNRIDKKILVIDRSHGPGAMNLSGAVVRKDAINALFHLPAPIPHDKSLGGDGVEYAPSVKRYLKLLDERSVCRDRLCFLGRNTAIKVPTFLLPPNLSHRNDAVISIGELCVFLEDECANLGIDVLHRTSAARPIVEGGKLVGIEVPEYGIGRDGNRRSNYSPPETILADFFVVADGSRGALSTRLASIGEAKPGSSPQVYSIGVKRLFRLPGKKPGRAGVVIHTLGYPLPLDMFGGGFAYGTDDRHVAVGLLVGLDWKYADTDPVAALDLFVRHPFIASMIDDGEEVCAGAKTVPEGGFAALEESCFPNAVFVGDAAGFVNIATFKGVHLAIHSGAAAGEALNHTFATGEPSGLGAYYTRMLRNSGVLRELYESRNFRQVFATPLGGILGGPLSVVQYSFPFTLRHTLDRCATKPVFRMTKKNEKPADKASFVYRSGSMHEEDSIAHVAIRDHQACRTCAGKFRSSCVAFCPGGVYERSGDAARPIAVRHTNCLHDKTCLVKCPYDNILWEEPFGGFGPRYRRM